MEWIPVRFYRYRYQDLWEAELPIGWVVDHYESELSLINGAGRTVFTIRTTLKADWESRYKDTEENRLKVLADYRMLSEEATERKPLMDYESWNDSLQTRYRTRLWRFSGKDFLMNVIQNTKVDKVDPAIDSVVDRFIATLSFSEN